MKSLFLYNWQVREEWFALCEQLPCEELLKHRTGGVGSILATLIHIIDVEYSWFCAIHDKEDRPIEASSFQTIEAVKALSDSLQSELQSYLHDDMDRESQHLVDVPWDNAMYSRSAIYAHLIAHEIHHIGQLSVWAREAQLEPVSAGFVGRKLG
ncbi:DinB family protein [Paenalkalicoccus suaedae]|uniref:DinB family protein n=1 Tax=Paenalkalicoccus suaedae TaxID=2592382 RepID=A0A859FJ59_9BACI|nr:DinB family protein [Paenalkalicoccus suaedae]QKS72526.1 DinB family protein [Paenalkalicoccus suaedae]